MTDMMGQWGMRPIINYNNYLTNKIIVTGLEEVKQYQVPAGGDYIFVHSTLPILFRKVVDTYGQFTISEFDIIERKVKDINGDKYVSIDEFEKLKAEIEKLKANSEVDNESTK